VYEGNTPHNGSTAEIIHRLSLVAFRIFVDGSSRCRIRLEPISYFMPSEEPTYGAKLNVLSRNAALTKVAREPNNMCTVYILFGGIRRNLIHAQFTLVKL
jgi:hypothetical protein